MDFLRISAVIFSLLIITIAGCGKSDDPNRHYEEEGGFSYVPPEGWEMGRHPDLKYNIFQGKREGSFKPSVNVVDERFNGSLESYADYNIDAVRNFVDDFNLVGRERFVTDDGLTGIKLTVDDTHFQRQLRQYFYLFEGEEKKYILTCSTLADVAGAFEPVFDKCIKTFRIE